jgi:pteridine reductase
VPESSLRGKTALVTGGAKRIGRAIAIAVAREGANVVVHYHSSAVEAEQLAAQLGGLGVRSWVIQAGFEQPQEYGTLIRRTLDLAGSLDILVNSAASFPAETLAEVSLQSLMENIEVNAWVPFTLARDFARHARRGKILNLLDSRLFGYDFKHVGYILSKHVLAVLTEMMALEFAPDITVNGIGPGLILPPPGRPDSYLDERVSTVPLKRHGGPEDIGEAAVYLLRSDFITGQVINVDGGRHLWEYVDGPHPG